MSETSFEMSTFCLKLYNILKYQKNREIQFLNSDDEGSRERERERQVIKRTLCAKIHSNVNSFQLKILSNEISFIFREAVQMNAM